MHALRLPLSAALVIALAPPAFGDVEGFKVTTDHTVDPTSLESIVRDVFRLSGAKTNDEKAIALYEYLHQGIFHRACPIEGQRRRVGPLKVLNAYGWALCGSQHTVLKALYETAGWKCRYLGWPGHSTVEVFYDGRWHYFDVFLKCYFWSKDRTHVVSQEEIANDPSLVLDAVREGRAAPQHLCCGDSPEDVVKGCKARHDYGDSKGWGEVTWRDENYSARLDLPIGASLRLDWSGARDGFVVPIPGGTPVHTCGLSDFVRDPKLGPLFEHYGPRSWSNGSFDYAPRFDRPAEVRGLVLRSAAARDGRLVATNGRGAAIFKAALPYPFVSANLSVGFAGGDGSLALSLDEGKIWTPARAGNLSAAVRQQYRVWIKVEFPSALTNFQLSGVVEHNRGVLPYLVNGKNRVTVSTEAPALPEGTVGTVTYAYQEATVKNPSKPRPFNGHGIEYGPVRTVTKEFTKTPFTFEVDVGGNTPPKMIAVERSVRAR